MGVPGEWQEEVRSYARLRRAGAAADHKAMAAGLVDLLVSQGFSRDHAADARRLIDRVTTGGDAPGFMIDVLVAGLETVGRQAPLAALRIRHREVTMRLWTLLRYLRQSGEIVYQLPGAPPLPELERRMLLELHDRPALRLTDFTAMFGLDKAQVSRAIRGLADDGLVERLGARGAIRTSAQGAALAARLVAVARTRSARLIEGVPADALADFDGLVTDITRRAVQLLRQEQGGEADAPAPQTGEYDQLPMSRLFSLFTYMQRGGALMIRRLADVSNFEWFVLSTVHEGGAMTPAAVVEAVARHHSQALRTLRRLVAVGLLDRPLVDGRPGPLVQPSAAGRVALARVEEEGWRRDTHLFGVIEPARLDRFVAVLDRMVENAIGETTADAD